MPGGRGGEGVSWDGKRGNIIMTYEGCIMVIYKL